MLCPCHNSGNNWLYNCVLWGRYRNHMLWLFWHSHSHFFKRQLISSGPVVARGFPRVSNHEHANQRWTCCTHRPPRPGKACGIFDQTLRGGQLALRQGLRWFRRWPSQRFHAKHAWERLCWGAVGTSRCETGEHEAASRVERHVTDVASHWWYESTWGIHDQVCRSSRCQNDWKQI